MILFSIFSLITLYDFSLSLLPRPFRDSQVDEGDKNVFSDIHKS